MGIWYSVKVRPYRFEPREVEAFVPFSNREPLVLVDGPTLSPHRYYVDGRGFVRLCIWYPKDPSDKKWRQDDGLLALFGLTLTHLIREGYYREDIAKYGIAEWLGPEAPHG